MVALVIGIGRLNTKENLTAYRASNGRGGRLAHDHAGFILAYSLGLAGGFGTGRHA